MNKFISNIIYNAFISKKKKNNQIIKETITNYYLNESLQDTDEETIEDEQPDSELDKALSGQDIKTTSYLRSNVPTIYAFITKHIPDMIKIGYTDQGARTRLKQWQVHYPDAELIGSWNATEYNIANERVFFKDWPVHARTNAKGFTQINDEEKQMFKQLEINKDLIDMHVSSEFFHKYKNISSEEKEELSAQIIEDIINELKSDIRNNTNINNVGLYTLNSTGDSVKADKLWGSPNTFSPTGLQQECINNGVNAIKNGDHDLLMAAVMRFGKTFSTYQIIKQAGIKYALVSSAKADVRSAWRNDINHIDFIDDFAFIEFIGKPDVVKLSMKFPNEGNIIKTKEDIAMYDEKGNHIIDRLLSDGKVVIVFCTLQDLAGHLEESNEFDFNGALLEGKLHTIKEQHQYLFDNPPEIMVIDETHYGSHSETLGAATGLKNMNSDEYTAEEIKVARDEIKDAEKYGNTIHAINAQVTLQCSGTPYYILQRGEFAETLEGKTIISKVSFTDMLNARDQWAAEHNDSEQNQSPYYGIPNIFKYGMQLSKKCRKELKDEEVGTNLTELFKMNNEGRFVHEDAIVELMTSIFGKKNNKKIGFLNKDQIINGEIFKHCIMVLPRIDACTALANLLREKNIIDENDREIIVLVEKKTKRIEGGREADSVAKTVDGLNEHLRKIDNEGKHSLMITVNRFLTGVSIPLADSMMYMKSAKSPQEYDQAIFRLCTRNVIKDNNGESVNMKPNVYLIDFDVDRMLQMTIKSAVAQCAAKGQSSPDDIQAAIDEQISTIPIYAEDHVLDDPDNIMDEMHEINSKDLLKIYADYNKNKDIESSISDIVESGGFNKFINNVNNIELIRSFERGNADRHGLEQEDGQDDLVISHGMEIDNDFEDFNSEVEKKENKKEDKANNKKIIQEIKEKFIGMLKNILYCNICLEIPCKDIDTFVKLLDQDDEVRQYAKYFKLYSNDIKEVYKVLTYNEKANINILLLNINTLMNDERLKPIDRAINAINKLGRLDDKKSGEKEVALVVTPPELVNKMIDKIPAEEMRKAESILEVNSKYGEFLIGIYKKYGKKVAEKVKIVPGDNRCKAFCKKILNLLNINEYNILDIEDLDRNGKYDVKDFLKLENSEILNMNKGKKFDVVLQNPPYGSVGGDTLHLKFVDKLLDLSDRQVVVMPFGFITKTENKASKPFKEKFNNYLTNIEEYSSKVFTDTGMGNVGIYEFISNKSKNLDIKITYINGESESIMDLTKSSHFTTYENNMLKYLINNGSQSILGDCGRLNSWKKQLIGLSEIDANNKLLEIVKESLKKVKKYYNEYPKSFGLTVNRSNGGMNGKAFTPQNGDILKSYNEFIQYFNDKKLGIGYNVLMFSSEKSAENCKIALNNSLLRFTIHKSQDDQNMTLRIYKYVPNIDWEDDRVLTDEGLLEVCGCPKDKAKEYAEYCKKYIEENVDNK